MPCSRLPREPKSWHASKREVAQGAALAS
jgi:hypothetical protein